MPRWAARADGNQPEIVKGLRDAGCYVQPLHTVGQGVPDLLVGYAAMTFLMEVKDPSKPKTDRALTPRQQSWHAAWRGRPVAVVESVEEALAVVGVRVAG